MLVLLLVSTVNTFHPTQGEISAMIFGGLFWERIWARLCSRQL